MKKIGIIFGGLVLISGGLIIFWNLYLSSQKEITLDRFLGSPSPVLSRSPSPSPRRTLEPSIPPSSNPVVLKVQFISQAPFGEWSDPDQENGCEEASVLMAMHWIRGTSTTLEQALSDMRAMEIYERQRFGTSYDLNVDDIVTLVKEYYHYDNLEVRRNITIADIKRELAAGNVVLTPMNGQLLGNPYFTPPGPDIHMVLIKGYDDATGQFITNDPGMKTVGVSYRYPYNVFFNAVREYQTGEHEPISTIIKSMVVIRPKVM